MAVTTEISVELAIVELNARHGGGARKCCAIASGRCAATEIAINKRGV